MNIEEFLPLLIVLSLIWSAGVFVWVSCHTYWPLVLLLAHNTLDLNIGKVGVELLKLVVVSWFNTPKRNPSNVAVGSV